MYTGFACEWMRQKIGLLDVWFFGVGVAAYSDMNIYNYQGFLQCQ
jgi:hypothetical protein